MCGPNSASRAASAPPSPRRDYEVPAPSAFLPATRPGQEVGPGFPPSSGSSLKGKGVDGWRMRARRPQARSSAKPHSPQSPGGGAARGPDATGGGHWYLPEWGRGKAPSWGAVAGPEPTPMKRSPHSAPLTRHRGRRVGRLEENRDVALPKSEVFLPGFTARAPSRVCKGWGSGGRAEAADVEGLSGGGAVE